MAGTIKLIQILNRKFDYKVPDRIWKYLRGISFFGFSVSFSRGGLIFCLSRLNDEANDTSDADCGGDQFCQLLIDGKSSIPLPAIAPKVKRQFGVKTLKKTNYI